MFEQLSLLPVDMSALQDEIVDVHRKIGKLEHLKEILFKERQSICPHPRDLRKTKGGQYYDADKVRGTRYFGQIVCGLCAKDISIL